MNRRDFVRHSGALGLSLPALGGLGFVAGTALSPAPASAAVAGQCVLGVTQEAVNFNPLLYVNTGVETSVEFIVFDALWKIDPDWQIRPQSRDGNPDARKRRHQRRWPHLDDQAAPDVTWHDGAPFTAADVIFTLETMMNPKVAVRSRNGHEHVASYEAVDDHTVQIVLKDDFAPYMVSWQKTSVIPEAHPGDVADINTAPFNTTPIGTGPFKFKNRVAGSYIEFEPNPKYHGGAPKLILAGAEISFPTSRRSTRSSRPARSTSMICKASRRCSMPRPKRCRARRSSSAPPRSWSSSISTAANRSFLTSGCGRRCIWRSTRRVGSTRSITAFPSRP